MEGVRGVRWCAGSAVALRIRVAVGRDVPHGGVEVEQLRLGAEGDPVEGGVRVPPLEPHREVDAREAPSRLDDVRVVASAGREGCEHRIDVDSAVGLLLQVCVRERGILAEAQPREAVAEIGAAAGVLLEQREGGAVAEPEGEVGVTGGELRRGAGLGAGVGVGGCGEEDEAERVYSDAARHIDARNVGEGRLVERGKGVAAELRARVRLPLRDLPQRLQHRLPHLRRHLLERACVRAAAEGRGVAEVGAVDAVDKDQPRPRRRRRLLLLLHVPRHELAHPARRGTECRAIEQREVGAAPRLLLAPRAPRREHNVGRLRPHLIQQT
mmetsp:Transcript_26835/g.78751  ORF Transcript_26835/g.78751 Transcript_26835/m.78751 type:complete len:326 (+) Transcript_26835:488-1465(+)